MTTEPPHIEGAQRPSRPVAFWERSLSVRYAILGLFILLLFFYLHFREVRVETLELGNIAPKYVVAQVDFSYYDDEATIILRQEAGRDISEVYQINPISVHQQRADFENLLRKDTSWREILPTATFEEIYRGIDVLEEALLMVRLTDPRTLKKMEEADLHTVGYFSLSPNEIEGEHPLPHTVWHYLEHQGLLGYDLSPSTITFLINAFRQRNWDLTLDPSAQRTLRKRVQAKVPDKYSKVLAGSRIIDQGERVAPRHLVMLQAMKSTLGEQRNLWHPLTLIGSLLMALIFTAFWIGYLSVYSPQTLASNRQILLLVTILVLTMGLSKIVEFFLISLRGNLLDIIRFPLLVPFAAIVLCSVMNSSIAFFATFFLTVLFSMTLPFERQGFLIINLAAALVAIFNVRLLRKRNEIFWICAKAWFCCLVVILAMHLYESSFGNRTMWIDIASAGMFMLVTAILVVGLLPLLESSFQVMTNAALMEYLDPDQPLLRRLSMEVPGTYQHSLVVANLAEAAATAIGANGLFCRVATLFHDIGKIATPNYFTENQPGGMDIHQLLTPAESAQVIMAHVPEGVSIARKAKLPEPFIDVIEQHHGTTMVYYFYRKQLDAMGGDTTKVLEKEFRYPGPKPQTKEAAMILIADSFEAASRSVEVPDEPHLRKLIDEITREKAFDGQFDECALTFQELDVVKYTMVKTIIAAGHSRVKYPKRLT